MSCPLCRSEVVESLARGRGLGSRLDSEGLFSTISGTSTISGEDGATAFGLL